MHGLLLLCSRSSSRHPALSVFCGALVEKGFWRESHALCASDRGQADSQKFGPRHPITSILGERKHKQRDAESHMLTAQCCVRQMLGTSCSPPDLEAMTNAQSNWAFTSRAAFFNQQISRSSIFQRLITQEAGKALVEVMHKTRPTPSTTPRTTGIPPIIKENVLTDPKTSPTSPTTNPRTEGTTRTSSLSTTQTPSPTSRVARLFPSTTTSRFLRTEEEISSLPMTSSRASDSPYTTKWRLFFCENEDNQLPCISATIAACLAILALPMAILWCAIQLIRRKKRGKDFAKAENMSLHRLMEADLPLAGECGPNQDGDAVRTTYCQHWNVGLDLSSDSPLLPCPSTDVCPHAQGSGPESISLSVGQSDSCVRSPPVTYANTDAVPYMSNACGFDGRDETAHVGHRNPTETTDFRSNAYATTPLS